MMKKIEPKVGEYWWAWPPDGKDAEPIEIFEVVPNGSHKLYVLGRSEPGHARQWLLERRIAGKPRP